MPACPLISVVMGVYNEVAVVSAAIDSICAQTFTDWELIIVDDGSTDGTGAVVAEYAARDRRIRVIHQTNAGLTMALIAGSNAARGEFIARQDADDVSLPQRLERQAAHLRANPQVAVVSCWAQFVGPEGEELELVTRATESGMGTRLLVEQREGPPGHGTAMFRRSAYAAAGGYRPEFYFSQDNDLWLRLIEHGELEYVGECLYRCRRCATGISGAQHGTQWSFGRLAFECHAARSRGESEDALLNQAARLADEVRARRPRGRAETEPGSDMLYIIGTQLARNGDRRGMTYLWRVVRRQPWHWRAWVRMLQAGASLKRRKRRSDPASAQP